ncbi:MAG TPA: hypothetical protein VNZ53_55480, partial [Steroidobacteraceae bacterium]|nr:hypothetical protein [Steroidobacteraceae bacterium]
MENRSERTLRTRSFNFGSPDEKGYKIFDWVLETNPLAYFTALVSLSKIVRVRADVSHRDGSKPRSVDEILQRVEEQNGKEGSCRVREVLSEGKTDGMSEEPASAVHLR